MRACRDCRRRGLVRRAVLGCILAVAICICLRVDGAAPAGDPPRPRLQARAESGPGPWDNDVLVYRVRAGDRPEALGTLERAGVPTVARLADGRLLAAFQHFPAVDREHFDRVAVCFSSDEGVMWSPPESISVEGMEGGLARPFDPTLVVLPDRRVRLYFTSHRIDQSRRGTPAIYSAVSEDGIHYRFEPGVRFAVPDRVVIDCAVALCNDVFHLFAPDNGTAIEFHGAPRREGERPGGRGYHAVSRDGLSFERVADVAFDSPRDRWLGNVTMDAGELAFFGTGPGPWPVRSADGVRWSRAQSASRLPGADPGAVKLRDGAWLVVVTGPPRPGTPSAEQRRAGFEPADMLDEPGRQRREAASEFRAGPAGARPIEQAGAAAPGRAEKVRSGFVTGQEADLMLGGFGFDTTGGALSFNHPTGLATDGKALLMTDRWNNRVLIWRSAPSSNTPPDLVLGQPDFMRNDPGNGRHQLNWPGNVAITPDSRRIAVTDTENNRILIWTEFPVTNGAPADLVLDLEAMAGGFAHPGPGPMPTGGPESEGAPRPRVEAPDDNADARPERDPPGGPAGGAPDPSEPRRPQGRGQRFAWPWGVWTDGEKFAVVATRGNAILIWNSFPARDNHPPDVVLRPRDAGTPRNITSDGESFFAVSDHNFGARNRPATMVWNSVPASASQPPDWVWGEWVKGCFTPDGKLIAAGSQSIYLWHRSPRAAETDADIVLRPATYRNGDGPDVVVANGRLYVCTYNGNHILGWNTVPTRDDQPPDFAVGSDRIDEDTWAGRGFIQNPVVATDGRSLFATSDFDRKMFVWRELPRTSAVRPDLTIALRQAPWDNELHGTTLALAGKDTVTIWRRLPLDGEPPEITLQGRIGSAELGEITGVAFDDRYFYLSDRRTGIILVWEGLPGRDSEPSFKLPMRDPGRLTSDGGYLCAAPFEGGTVQLWRVSELGSQAQPAALGGRGQFNLPSEVLVADGRLFVCNRGFNRVDVWDRVEDAVAGHAPESLLGVEHAGQRRAAIGRNRLFMPGSLAWDGSGLWVGEFKFSTRILRFSPARGAN